MCLCYKGVDVGRKAGRFFSSKWNIGWNKGNCQFGRRALRNIKFNLGNLENLNKILVQITYNLNKIKVQISMANGHFGFIIKGVLINLILPKDKKKQLKDKKRQIKN